jgi:hypothetical protein
MNTQKKAEKRLEKLKTILETKTYAKIGGATIDLVTANVMVQVVEALNEANRVKFLNMPIQRMTQVAWALVRD